MDIRQMEYFHAVVTAGSFTGAAEAMHVSQPAITTTVKNMEDELGVKLMVRDKRHIVLTREGQLFDEKIVPLISQFYGVIDEMKHLSSEKEKMLRIGLIPVGGASVTTLLHTGFKKRYPAYNVSILEFGSFGCLEAVENGDIDLAFIVLMDHLNEQFNHMSIHKGVVRVVMHRSNPLSSKESVSARDLIDQDVILLPSHAFVTRSVNAVFEREGITPHVIARPSQMFSVFNLIEHNAGISFVLGEGFSYALDSDNIVSVPLSPAIPYELGFVWRKDRPLNRAAKDCLSYVRDAFRG